MNDKGNHMKKQAVRNAARETCIEGYGNRDTSKVVTKGGMDRNH